jgi:DNA polymerase III delta' subunit
VTRTAAAGSAGSTSEPDRDDPAGPGPALDAGPTGRDESAPGAAAGRMLTRGHDRAVATVRRMIARRVPHAILVSGPAGIGKTTLALDLAAGLLCDDPMPAARPCRACRSCRLVARSRHPDVHRLAPSGPGDQIRIGARDGPEDGTVRRLAADLVLTAVEGGARIAIIERADRLTDDAQTALLKTLEEPPPGVTIVLCADDEDRLMPTVRSRSARIRLGPVATRDIEAILSDAGVADPPVAARLARIASGRPGSARTLARAPDAVSARDEIARLLLDLLVAPTAARLAAARELTTRSTAFARAFDRGAALADGAADAGVEPTKRGRLRSKGPAATDLPTSSASPITPVSATGDDADGTDEVDATEDAGAGKTSVPAAERRRAASVLVGLWRELTRDLLVVMLGEERQVRDPALLDDLRVAAGSLGSGGTALGAFLGRLDGAGELLEANVRPELVLDTLLLHWPRAATR